MADLIGTIGVALLLLAFLLNLSGKLSQRSRAYAALNAVGVGLACAAAALLPFMPFVVLEGTWALVAVVALARPRRESA
jgi:VIT1/CCC1 family predicted Fe2+/Mn2+ transporter